MLRRAGKFHQATAAYPHALQRLKRLDDAIGSYRRSLDADPAYVLTYSDLGGALGERGEVEESTGYLRRTSALDPGAGPRFVA